MQAIYVMDAGVVKDVLEFDLQVHMGLDMNEWMRSIHVNDSQD